MEDLLIRGGQVIDGTGTLARRADVAIRDGRITAVGGCQGLEARQEIDASGHIVAPGFIDIHTHSDFTIPLNPLAESKIRQGVTTEVVGNCGYSTAPVLPGKAEALQDYLRVGAPWLEYEPRTFAQYLDGFPATSVNTVMQVGHATLRLMAMGLEARDPTADELSHMRQLLAEGLAAGALGMSTGLFTAPGNYARSEELLALAGVLRRHGATYASHIRDEANHVFDADRLADGIGENAGVRVQIAHLKLSGTDNWGDVPSLLSLISEARERGVDLFCDQYPYTAGTNPLRNLLPVWVQDGGVEAMLQRLRDGESRERIRGDILQNGSITSGESNPGTPSASPLAPRRRNWPARRWARWLRPEASTIWTPPATYRWPTGGTPTSWSPRWRKRTCRKSCGRQCSWWAPTGTRWRPTELRAKASRTPASTAHSCASWATTSATWACFPCTPPSTR